MNFSTDRDLLTFEPNLFAEALFASQMRLEVTDGAVSGTALTSASANFTNAGIEAGDIVLIAGVAGEVTARVNATTLTVSKLRARLVDDMIPPGNGTSLTIVHRTFEPQAKQAHDELLRKLGIDPDGGGPVTEDAIVSLSLMRELESLSTIARLYDAAVALGAEDDNTVFRAKAAAYQKRYLLACRSGVVRLDLNGDGEADAFRDLSLIELLRV